MKRAPVTGITRDKEYSFIKEHKSSRIIYLSRNPNGEAEVVRVYLKPKPRLKNLIFEMDFSELAIKGKAAIGNILTRHAVHKIIMKEKGISTLGGRKIWWDEDVLRLNADGRGKFLGEFIGDDRILVISKSGNFRISNFDLSNHYEDDVFIIEKFHPGKVFSAVYFDAEQNYYYVKRFKFEESEKLQSFISEAPGSKLIRLTEVEYPRLEVKFGGKNKSREPEIIEVADFIGIKSFKAKGKRLSNYEVSLINELEPLIKQVEPEIEADEASSDDSGQNPLNTQMTLDL
jgi:topoisomerase-4 subunit A